MKRNMERSSGSSDEDKKALKKAKKENSGKLKNAEMETGESIDGSKKRVTNCKGKVEEPLLKAKKISIENAGDQKATNNKMGCNVNHKNDSTGKETENKNEDIIAEIKLASIETFTTGKYKKNPNSCNDETKLDNILEESVSNCDHETTDEDGRGDETVINDQEYILLAEQLTGLFREIYRDAIARNGEENSISKCQIRSKTLDSVIKISNAKGESYLCNFRTNSNYACNVAEKSDESLGKEVNYSSDNEVRNERLDESNIQIFRENATNSESVRDISSEKCGRIVCEESNSSWSSEMNEDGFRKLSSNTEEYGVQSGQTNGHRKGNSNAIKTDKFAKCQSDSNSHEECGTRVTSDEASNSSSDVKMSDEGKYSSGDAEYDRRCNELMNAEKIKKIKCKVENDTKSSADRSELNGGSDMSTDEDSWSDDRKSAEENGLGTEDSDSSSAEESGDESTDEISDEETDSPGTEESDNSDEEESNDDNTDQSSDEVSSSYGEENSETSSGKDDSTDSESSVGENGDMSTDENSSNESEYDTTEEIDENPEEDENTSYGEGIDSEREDTSSLSSRESSKIKDITDDDSSNSACEERNNSSDQVEYYRSARKVNVTRGDVGPSVIYGNAYNYRSKEIISSSTEDENCLDCAKDCSSSEIEYLSDAENIKNRTLASVSEVNDESNNEGSRSSDVTCGLENLFDSVLGFASYRRLSIATIGQDSFTISVTRLKLMPFKDSFRKSVDGRHKKRNVANRKGNIITPPVRGNFREEKTEKRGRNTIPYKVSAKNKAAEVSDAEEQTSDEEWQVKDSTGKKSRNKMGNKQIEYDSDHEKDSESDEEYEEDENSSGEAGENNGKGHGEEDEDVGEEDSDEDYEEEADNEFDEDDDEAEEEESGDEDEYVEVEEEGDSDSEEEENGGENEEDIEEEEENHENVGGNVTAQMQNDSDQSSDNDQWKTVSKTRTATKKKAAKEQARGKTNLVKKKKDRGE